MKASVERDNEYLTPGRYVTNTVVQRTRGVALRHLYRELDPARPFVYFPLHVTDDFKIKKVIPHCIDQGDLIQQVADSLPHGYDLVLKEHPWSIGRNPLSWLKRVLRRPNIRLVDPYTSSHELMAGSAAVVVISSTVGLEALLHGKPVLTLGRPYYAGYGVTVDIESFREIRTAVPHVLESPPDREAVLRFLGAAMRTTYPGAPQGVDSSSENASTLAGLAGPGRQGPCLTARSGSGSSSRPASSTAGGTARAALSLQRSLEARDDVEVTAIAHPGEPGAGTRGRIARGLRRELSWLPVGLSRESRRRNLDLLHCPGPVVPWRSSVPLVVTIFDALPWSHPEWLTRANVASHRLVVRPAVRRAAAVITASEPREDARSRDVYGIAPERIHVVPLGVDASFSPGAVADEVLAGLGVRRPFVLTVGTLQPRKNLESALSAFELLVAAGADLTLVVAGGAGLGGRRDSGADRAQPGARARGAHRACGRRRAAGPVPGRGVLRVSLPVRGIRPARAGGHGGGHPGRVQRPDQPPGGGGRRRAPGLAGRGRGHRGRHRPCDRVARAA